MMMRNDGFLFNQQNDDWSCHKDSHNTSGVCFRNAETLLVGGSFSGDSRNVRSSLLFGSDNVVEARADLDAHTLAYANAGSTITQDRFFDRTAFSLSRAKEHMRNINCIPLNNGGSVLYPPVPGTFTSVRRERPNGCKTCFIGNIPEACSDDLLHEIFSRCGHIQSLRRNRQKNFAHLRFSNAEAVELALAFAGFRLCVGNRLDTAHSSRLHVDYAEARDDQHEWKLEQRAVLREKRRHDCISPSAPLAFSDHEASGLVEKLKSHDTFDVAAATVLNWLERGDCTRRSCSTFYNMIGAVNAHSRRLWHDKRQYLQEMYAFTEQHKLRQQRILVQLRQIERVLQSARKQKNFDNFSKPQRRQLDLWLRQAEELRQSHESQMLKDRQEEEMDTSDDEACGGDGVERKRGHIELGGKSLLQAAIDSDVHRSVEVFQLPDADVGVDQCTTSEIASLRASLQTQHERLCEYAAEIAAKDDEICKLRSRLEAEQSIVSGSISRAISPPRVIDSNKEARLIAVLATFLHVHPFGATLDYLLSYLQCIMPDVKSAHLETVLEKHSALFRLTTSGVGVHVERKWSFVGFDTTLDS